jgi:hypothetical protein
MIRLKRFECFRGHRATRPFFVLAAQSHPTCKKRWVSRFLLSVSSALVLLSASCLERSNLNKENESCGGLGQSCLPEQSCCPAKAPGESSKCVYTSTNSDSCGACGTVCGPNQACNFGRCVDLGTCDVGYFPCPNSQPPGGGGGPCCVLWQEVCVPANSIRVDGKQFAHCEKR